MNPNEILNSPDYINANAETKQAIFDKHIASSQDYTDANPDTQLAIQQRFGLAPVKSEDDELAAKHSKSSNWGLAPGVATLGLLGGFAAPKTVQKGVDLLTPPDLRGGFVPPAAPNAQNIPSAAAAAAPDYFTPHGAGTGAVKNAEHNLEQILKNRVSEASLKTPGYSSPGNSLLLVPDELKYSKPSGLSSLDAAPAATPPSAPPPAKQFSEYAREKLRSPSIDAPGRIGSALGSASALGLGADAFQRAQRGDVPGAATSGVGSAGALASLHSNPKIAGAGKLGLLAALGAKGYQAFSKKENKAAGGVIKGYANLGSVKRLGEKVAKKAFSPAHTIGDQKPVKMSDWAQNYMDQYIVPIQADRMGGVGGPSYSANQLLHPQYKDVAWGSGQPGTATMIANLAKDPRFGGVKNQIFTPSIGDVHMHKSNQIVHDMLADKFYKNIDKLTPEMEKKINDYMRLGGPKSTGKLSFDPMENFNVRDREQLAELAKTFEKRKLISQHAFGGEGIGGRKAQIIPYEEMLHETSDPFTHGADTFSLGPRAFKLSGETNPVPRPDLNVAYPYQLHGEDLGVTYQNTPSQFGLMDFQNQWRKDTGNTSPLKSGKLKEPGYYEHTLGYTPPGSSERVYPRQKATEEWIKELWRNGMAEGGEVKGYSKGKAVGKALDAGLGFFKPAAKSHSQDPVVARALEEYLKGNISQAERIAIMNKQLPLRPWTEMPPTYSDDQIKMALMENKRPKALLPVPEGMRVGNRLDIPAYTQNGVYVDTTHDLAKGNSPISYNRTGHLKDVEFSSKPNQAVRVGLGTKEQALTPMGAEMGSAKSPFALIKGTNVGTSDEEVRRMMSEMMKDPSYAQIGMDPRRHSQFYDKSTGMPVWAAEEKLQSGPLILAPRRGLETTSWDDPRLNLSDFEGKRYKDGGSTTPAWQRSEGKNPEGGLNAVGRASYNRETGGNLKAPQPEGGPRKKSFCARMEGMKKKNTSSATAKDPDSRINKSLRKWKC